MQGKCIFRPTPKTPNHTTTCPTTTCPYGRNTLRPPPQGGLCHGFAPITCQRHVPTRVIVPHCGMSPRVIVPHCGMSPRVIVFHCGMSPRVVVFVCIGDKVATLFSLPFREGQGVGSFRVGGFLLQPGPVDTQLLENYHSFFYFIILFFRTFARRQFLNLFSALIHGSRLRC